MIILDYALHTLFMFIVLYIFWTIVNAYTIPMSMFVVNKIYLSPYLYLNLSICVYVCVCVLPLYRSTTPSKASSLTPPVIPLDTSLIDAIGNL